mgnify:CR=1 FL=1
MERVYNKLVRDKIPDIIEEKGEIPIVKILEKEEYKKELERKLYEEYKEVLDAKSDDRIEELADMLEVIQKLEDGKELDDILEIANSKKKKRGAFEKGIFLLKVIEPK